MKTRKFLCSAALALLFCGSELCGQSATLSGQVADPSDSIVREAEVTLTSELNRVPNEPLYLYDSALPGWRRINYNAFIAAPNNVDGDVGRNVARGFGATQVDLALRRDFRLTDRFGLQFRAEAFNLFNNPIFGAVSNMLTAGSRLFGTATNTLHNQLRGLNALHQTGGPRSLQLSLRLRF